MHTWAHVLSLRECSAPVIMSTPSHAGMKYEISRPLHLQWYTRPGGLTSLFFSSLIFEWKDLHLHNVHIPKGIQPFDLLLGMWPAQKQVQIQLTTVVLQKWAHRQWCTYRSIGSDRPGVRQQSRYQYCAHDTMVVLVWITVRLCNLHLVVCVPYFF